MCRPRQRQALLHWAYDSRNLKMKIVRQASRPALPGYEFLISAQHHPGCNSALRTLEYAGCWESGIGEFGAGTGIGSSTYVTLGEVMIGLSIIRDTSKRDAAFQATLCKTFSIEFKDLGELASCKAGQYSLVDFEFVHVSGIPVLKEWIRNKPKGAKVIFVTNKASHLQATRALAIGATGIVHHPVEPQVLLDKLLNGSAPSADKSSGELSSLSSDPAMQQSGNLRR
jgi:CheY-like chemotaxis protein